MAALLGPRSHEMHAVQQTFPWEAAGKAVRIAQSEAHKVITNEQRSGALGNEADVLKYLSAVAA